MWEKERMSFTISGENASILCLQDTHFSYKDKRALWGAELASPW